MPEETNAVLDMIRRQLQRRNPPDTKALYGRALRIDESVRELSLRQFNAKYVLRVRREKKKQETDPASNPPSPDVTEEARARIRDVFLQLARDVGDADRAGIIDVVEGVDGYVEQVVEALQA